MISFPAGLPLEAPVQLKSYGAVPSLTVKSIVPLASPLHNASVLVLETVIAAGAPIVTDSLPVHPLASTILIV